MTKEEVIISLGLDNASMRTGLKGLDWLVKESLQDTMGSVKGLVSMNVVGLGMKVAELWDRVTKTFFANMFSAQYQQFDVLSSKTVDNLRKLVKEASQARKKFQEASEDFKMFTAKDETARLEILTKRRAEAEAKQDRIARDLMMRRKFYEMHSTALTAENRAKALADISALEIQINLSKADGLKLEKEIAGEERKRMDKRKQDEARQSQVKELHDAKVLSAREAAVSAAESLEGAKRARRTFTLEEMAASPFMQGTRWGNQAQWILQLQEWSKSNAMLGFQGRSDWQQKRADELMEDLQRRNPFLRDPLRDLKATADKQLDRLNKIAGEGVNIIPND